MQALDISIQLFVESMSGQCRSISQYNQLHTGTSNSYIHTTQIIQKTNLPFFIGTHQTDENNITLLPLKAIDRIDGYRLPVRLEKGIIPNQPAQILHLCLVRRNQTDINPFTQKPLPTNFGNILL